VYFISGRLSMSLPIDFPTLDDFLEAVSSVGGLKSGVSLGATKHCKIIDKSS